jgi:hypothetical protein
MARYDQEDASASIDEMTKKMESYFLTTQEEMRLLRAELAELTKLIKSQRMVNVAAKQIGAPSISDLLNQK